MSEKERARIEDLRGRTYHKVCNTSDIVAKAGGDSGNGYIEGFLAKYGNVDQGGDRIMPGTFTKSIKERVPAGKVPLMLKHFGHGGDVVDAIGLITSARDQTEGLWIHAELSSVTAAQETRTKVSEGIVKGLSVGFQLLGFSERKEGDNWVFEITEGKLIEGTVTVKPMNEEAVILQAKSLQTRLAEALDDPAATRGDIVELSKSIDLLVASITNQGGSTEHTEGLQLIPSAELEAMSKSMNEKLVFLTNRKLN